METKFISGKNYFNNDSLKEMIKELDCGNEIEVYISCIGHTRNNMTQEDYKKALKQHYGDKLEITYQGGCNCYSYSYKLNEVESAE